MNLEETPSFGPRQGGGTKFQAGVHLSFRRALHGREKNKKTALSKKTGAVFEKFCAAFALFW